MHARRFTVLAILAAALMGGALLMGQANRPAVSMEDAQKKLVKTARDTDVAFIETQDLNPFTPQLMEARFTWSRRILEAELTVAKTPEERVKVAQAHLDRMNELAAKIKSRTAVDTNKVTVCQAAYFVADGEATLARESK